MFDNSHSDLKNVTLEKVIIDIGIMTIIKILFYVKIINTIGVWGSSSALIVLSSKFF